MKITTVLGLLIFLCWGVNLYKFCKLDFEPNYKSEVIRGVCIFIWPATLVVAWIDIGEENE